MNSFDRFKELLHDAHADLVSFISTSLSKGASDSDLKVFHFMLLEISNDQGASMKTYCLFTSVRSKQCKLPK